MYEGDERREIRGVNTTEKTEVLEISRVTITGIYKIEGRNRAGGDPNMYEREEKREGGGVNPAGKRKRTISEETTEVSLIKKRNVINTRSIRQFFEKTT